MSSWLVVGISGVTNGGKSTLTRQLHTHLPMQVRVLSQDEYFYLEDSPHHIPSPGSLSHNNWEVLTALDMKRMMCDVTEIINTRPGINGTFQSGVSSPNSDSMPSPVLLIDGFILYDHPGIMEVCDMRYFLTLSKEECWERRSVRTYDPPDPPGYFEACVWPMYEEHVARVRKSVANVVYLDGMDDNFSLVLKQITAAALRKGGKY